MTSIRILAPSLVLAAGLCASFAAAARECLPRIEDAWLRLPPVSMPMLAGFARIENDCRGSFGIVGARSDAFADVSVHETRVTAGVSRMRAVAEVPVEPGAEVLFKPGGLHLMLMQPVRPLKPGERVVVELLLRDGQALRGEFLVKRAGDAR